MTITAEEVLEVLCGQLTKGLEEGFIRLVTYGRGQARRESTENEEIIGASLRAFAAGHPIFNGALSFSVSTNGDWYDFLVASQDRSTWIPINLKVSNLRGNDNVASKAGLFYALTGMLPAHPLIRNWDEFCRNLAENLRSDDCDSDYYFLIVEKSPEGVGRVFWTSLLRLKEVTPNGSNPPFQACWMHNLERAERSRAESIDYLLDAMGQTFVLRARALDSFRSYLVPSLGGELRKAWLEQLPYVEGEAE